MVEDPASFALNKVLQLKGKVHMGIMTEAPLRLIALHSISSVPMVGLASSSLMLSAVLLLKLSSD